MASFIGHIPASENGTVADHLPRVASFVTRHFEAPESNTSAGEEFGFIVDVYAL